MQVIQHQELGSAQASITFSSIPQTMTDLVLLVSARTTNPSGNYWNNIRVTFNGSSTGYSERYLYGTGAGTGSGTSATSYLEFQYAVSAQGTTSNTFSNLSLYIPNYRTSNNKSVSVDSVTENNATNALANITAGLWSNSAAITSITLNGEANGGQFAAYTSATLYGVLAGSDGIVTVS
jgi:hypothetical protein